MFINVSLIRMQPRSSLNINPPPLFMHVQEFLLNRKAEDKKKQAEGRTGSLND